MDEKPQLTPQNRYFLTELMALHSAVESLFGALHRSQPRLAQEVLEELEAVGRGLGPDFQPAHQRLVVHWKESIAPD